MDNQRNYVGNTSTEETGNAISDKKKSVAMLLCLFVGSLGFHRFDVGKTKSGILYLLTGGIIGIGVFIDFIALCLGKAKDKNGAVLR